MRAIIILSIAAGGAVEPSLRDLIPLKLEADGTATGTPVSDEQLIILFNQHIDNNLFE